MIREALDPTPICAAARQALSDGDIRQCVQLCADLIERVPRAAEAHFLLGLALAQIGRNAAALQSIEHAVLLDPNADYRAHEARLLILLRREAPARAAADLARQTGSDDPLTLDTLGCVYARLGEHDVALPLFQQAVSGAPDNESYRFNLASTHGFFGDVDAAEAQYEAILALNPTQSKAHYGLATLRKQRAETNHTDRLEQALTIATDPIDHLRIHYAAAKEYEDLGAHEAVFHHLHTGNRDHKQRSGYSMAADAENFEAIRTQFDDPAYFAGTSPLLDSPIFVVGMPRTGTTLVDRILSSHPQVSSAGELQSMPLAIKRLSQTNSRIILDPETIMMARDLTPAQVGLAYLQSARQHSGARQEIFVDKMPLNFLYIGFIARALPNARIVCLRRNPMDSIWSNFKNLFATSSSYYGYSYDLMDTAQFYLLFDELMRFWKGLFPGRILELSYEGLIDSQEAETRRLLDHCGLPWDEACLNFHANQAAVATPSAQQVRRPLYRDSLQKWRFYETHLAPVMDLLTRHGISSD
jgi:tetratricopeptide (TPR) repeat protein